MFFLLFPKKEIEPSMTFLQPCVFMFSCLVYKPICLNPEVVCGEKTSLDLDLMQSETFSLRDSKLLFLNTPILRTKITFLFLLLSICSL